MAVANAVAYYNLVTITVMKSFAVQAPGFYLYSAYTMACTVKLLTAIIYGFSYYKKP